MEISNVSHPVRFEATVNLRNTTATVSRLLLDQHQNVYDADLQQEQHHQQQPQQHALNDEDDIDVDWTKTCDVVYNPKLSQNFLEFWMCGVVLNVVAILGILGNVVSMCILSRPQMRSSINYLLVGLGICDTVLIVASMLVFGIPSIYPYTGYLFLYYNYVYPFIAPVVFPIAMIAQTSSIYMTFIVTLERYVAVCHPLKARALCTYGRAKVYFITCVTFAFLYNMSRFWEVLVVSHQPTESPVQLHCVRPSVLRQNPTYINVYIHWCYMIVNFVVPLLLLAILNSLIYRQVRLANQERQRLSRSEKREIGLATMLFCVVVVFLTLNSLALVVNVSEAFYNFIDPSLTKISNLMVTINSSCNFVIYVLFGEKFRRIFCQIFFKRWHRPNISDNIAYDSSTSNNDETTVIKYKSSGRFSRQNTARSTTSTASSLSPKTNSSSNVMAMKPKCLTSVEVPIVYYPKRDWQRENNNSTMLGRDWFLNTVK